MTFTIGYSTRYPAAIKHDISFTSCTYYSNTRLHCIIYDNDEDKKILLHVGALEIRSVRQRIPVSAKLILKK